MNIHLLASLFLLITLSFMTFAWAEPDRKPSVRSTASKTDSDKKIKNDAAVIDKDIKSEKKGASVKKNAAKNAGAAAAAAVATKKVTSTIKK